MQFFRCDHKDVCRFLLLAAIVSYALDASAQFSDDILLRATVAILIPTVVGSTDGGTGFLLNAPDKTGAIRTYLVTARHVVEEGFCSGHIFKVPQIWLQLSDGDQPQDAHFRAVVLPLIENGVVDWKAPEDDLVDLAVVPLPRGFLANYRERPLTLHDLATSSQVKRLVRVGVPVQVTGLDAGVPFVIEHKVLRTSAGAISMIPDRPILWTYTCTRGMRNVVTSIIAAPGNSGAPVVYIPETDQRGGKRIEGPIIGILSAGDAAKPQSGMVTADYLLKLLKEAGS